MKSTPILLKVEEQCGEEMQHLKADMRKLKEETTGLLSVRLHVPCAREVCKGPPSVSHLSDVGLKMRPLSTLRRR
jgi:hypothetical protein